MGCGASSQAGAASSPRGQDVTNSSHAISQSNTSHGQVMSTTPQDKAAKQHTPAQQPATNSLAQPAPPEISTSKVEQVYSNNRKVIKTVFKVAAVLFNAASALPGAGLVAEAMTLVVDAADQAHLNKKKALALRNRVLTCNDVFELIKDPDRLKACKRQLEQLLAALKQTHQVLRYWSQDCSMLQKVALAKCDDDEFTACKEELEGAMMEFTMMLAAMGITYSYKSQNEERDAASAASPVIQDDMAGSALTQELCKLANCDDPGLAFSILQETGRLTELIQAKELLSDKDRELLQRVAAPLKLEDFKRMREAAAACMPPAMPAYLEAWWKDAIDDDGLAMSDASRKGVPAMEFLQLLVEWYTRQQCIHVLNRYDDKLVKAGDQQVLTKDVLDKHRALLGTAASGSSAAEQVLQMAKAPVFLHHVLLPMLDADMDGHVSCLELAHLHMRCEEFVSMKRKKFEPPVQSKEGFLELMGGLWSSLDIPVLKQRLLAAVADQTRRVVDALQAHPIIQSYKVVSLLADYVPGSRAWLYDKLTEWLDAQLSDPASGTDTSNATSKAASGTASRLFLLLADAGMGKSVFSAVVHNKLLVRSAAGAQCGKTLVMAQHFFKVGEARSQAKAMITCLAAQLAEQLPVVAEALVPVVEKHGAGGNLSLLEAFEQFVLQPLQALEAQDKQPPTVLLLIDAMDEADDGKGEWLPVAVLIAREFQRLPPFVRIVLTSRPEATRDAMSGHTSEEQRGSQHQKQKEPHKQQKPCGKRIDDVFKAWHPVWIKPDSHDNTADMQLVLRHRLAQGSPPLVAEADRSAAVSLMTRKSRGQFVWLKFALEHLAQRTRDSWTEEELAVALLDGVFGTYRYLLGSVKRALVQPGASANAQLWSILHDKLLPVLMVARKGLTVSQLAWMAGVDLGQVTTAVELLAALFPARRGPGGGERVILPYHKSVLDFLGNETDAGPELVMDKRVGHKLAGLACVDLVLGQDNGDGQATQQVQYALRHGLYHLCCGTAAAGDSAALALERLLLSFEFWYHVQIQGCRAAVLRDVLTLASQTTAVDARIVQDVCRWQQMWGDKFDSTSTRDSVLFTALQCPVRSHVFRAAEAASGQWRTLRALGWHDDWPALIRLFTEQHVWRLAMAPDGTKFASGNAYGAVRMWDTATCECIATLQGHVDAVCSVVFNPDGTKLASGSCDKTVRVWDTATCECIATLQGHVDAVFSVVFNPDGTKLASGSSDKTVRVWDAATGECAATLKFGQFKFGLLDNLVFSPDGKKLAATAWDHTMPVCDAATGECIATLQGHTAHVFSVAFSPDGTKLASGSSDKTVRLWDAATGECIAALQGHDAHVLSVAFSPDGTKLGSGSNDVRVWDTATGECIATLHGHDSSECVTKVVYSPDGTKLASAGLDSTVRVWDTVTGECTVTLNGHALKMINVVFTPDGTKLATCDGHTLRLWDAGTSSQFAPASITSMVVSPDGTQFVSVSDDNSVRIWDMATGGCCSTLSGHTASVTRVVFSPDGTRLVSVSDDNTVRIWDTATGGCCSTVSGHTASVTRVVFSPDGTKLASSSSDKTVRFWDAATGECCSTLSGHTASVTSVVFSPDGTKLASGGDNDTVRIWDAATGECISILSERTIDVSSEVADEKREMDAFQEAAQLAARNEGKSDEEIDEAGMRAEYVYRLEKLNERQRRTVTSVLFNQDGTKLMSCSADSTVRTWDTVTGVCCITGKATQGVRGMDDVVRSPDGNKMVLCSDDNNAHMWDVATGERVATLQGHTAGVTVVVFSPDGTKLASASDDKTVRVWDAVTGECLATLQRRAEGVRSMVFSPNGTKLASGSRDNNAARVWDAATGECIATLQGHTADVTKVVFSPDGTKLVSVSNDDTVRIWDAASGQSKVYSSS